MHKNRFCKVAHLDHQFSPKFRNLVPTFGSLYYYKAGDKVVKCTEMELRRKPYHTPYFRSALNQSVSGNMFHL